MASVQTILQQFHLRYYIIDKQAQHEHDCPLNQQLYFGRQVPRHLLGRRKTGTTMIPKSQGIFCRSKKPKVCEDQVH